MNKRLPAVVLLFLFLLQPGFADRIRVGVSVLPLEFLVQSIGGERVEVSSLQKEGDSCSVFEPRPSTISWLSGAEAFFRSGVGFENNILHKLSHQNKGLEVLDLRDALDPHSLMQLDHTHHPGDDHAHGHGHEEEATDPHVWMNPANLSRMGYFIADALSRMRPDNAGEFQANAKLFSERMHALDHKMKKLLEPFAGRSFFIYHPALGYFASAYGLKQVSIQISGQAPSISELQRLIRQAREEKIRIIFVQPQESRRQAEVVAESVGCRVETIDPMSPNLEESLMQVARSLVESFSSQ